MIRPKMQFFRDVIIYEGHKKHPALGPYAENVLKRISMFNELNTYRKRRGQPQWNVIPICGENLVQDLSKRNPKETLLVIPAGQSSNLDRVFSIAETTFLKEEFFTKGGRGYFNCGSAYWVSEKRIYKDLCLDEPTRIKMQVKSTNLPLFEGISQGPLCPYPGKKYNVGFFSDAVTVLDEQNPCTLYLSGGGSFFPRQESSQRTQVLAKYSHAELLRLGKTPAECALWENAVILASVGEGAVLLSMFHPYYGAQDINVPLYEKMFMGSGTDWKAVKQRLSSLDARMHFFLESMLGPLERNELQGPFPSRDDCNGSR